MIVEFMTSYYKIISFATVTGYNREVIGDKIKTPPYN